MAGRKVHFEHSNYAADHAGNVYNVKRDKEITGYKGNTGYIAVTINGKRTYAHRFVWECFHGKQIPEKHQIDHVNGDKLDNSIENLQCLSHSDHAKKTARDNPDRITKRQDTVKAVCCQHQSGNITRYASVREAVTMLNGVYTNEAREKVYYAIYKNTKYLGFTWSWETVPDLEGEVWVCLLDPKYQRVRVSDQGRVMLRRSNKVTYGNDAGGYKMVNLGTGHCVHRLVAMAFLGEPPTPDHTVDHINRDKSDNRLVNLRWATNSEQSRNRQTTQAVTAYNLDGTVHRSFECAHDAAVYCGAPGGTRICRACKGTEGIRYGYAWRYSGDPAPSVEEIDAMIKRTKRVAAYWYESGEFFKEWDSVKDAALEINGQTGNITSVIHGWRNFHKGLVFQYL